MMDPPGNVDEQKRTRPHLEDSAASPELEAEERTEVS